LNVAVTACNGRLGRAILRYLCDEIGAEHVIGVARVPARIEIDGIDKRAGDYQSTEAMTAALRGVDTVIMISAPVALDTDRVRMHRNVIEAAKSAGVRKLLFTSIIGNGKEAGTLYEPTQNVNRQAEADIMSSGLEWVIGRNGLYIELDLNHILRANESGVYSNNGGEGRCGYLTIDELAYAFARLATSDAHNGKVFNLIGELQTQAELVATANEVFGLNVEYRPISDEANIARFMADAAIAARGRVVAEMLTGCFQCIRNGAFDVPSNYAEAAGRPPKTIRRMMEEVRDASTARGA
jgi:NAD(P)H dehydrogenase (quinone)